MFDFKFDWCKEMEIGVPIIDDQHQIMFQIGRDLEQLTIRSQNATKKELLCLVCELRDYTSYHLYTEEKLMAKYNFPKIDEHTADHARFRKDIVNINLPELGKHPELVLPQIKESLQLFLFSHVIIQDKELGDYIQTCVKK